MAGKQGREGKDIQQDRLIRNLRLSLAIPTIILFTIFLIAGLWWFIAPTTPSERKDLVQAIGVLLASIAALVGLYFTSRTVQTNQRTLQTNLKNTRRTLELAEQGQVTERFTRAIDQLGASDDQGKAKLEIRLGGIYALERIAKDSPERDHQSIMEILTTYVRENAPWPPDEFRMGASALTGNKQVNEPAVQAATSPSRPSADIQAILHVLRRRKEDELALDLQGTNLRGATLSEDSTQETIPARWEADFRRARLINSNLQGTILQKANLHGARMRYARLYRASLQKTNLQKADLSNANLGKAQLNGTDLREATLLKADLREADAKEADLREANLFGADLRKAKLMEADLRGAHLYKADLRNAGLEEANLKEADLGNADLRDTDLRFTKGLAQHQIEAATTDETTKLPKSLLAPP